MRIAFLSAALLASGAAVAATPVDGLYASVFGGYTFMPANTSFTTTTGILVNGTSYDSGYNVGGRFGYKSTPLRYEGEITYMQADLDKFYINGIRQTGISGQTSATAAMANVYYDFPDMVPCVSPFVGVGLGFVGVDAKLNSAGPNGYTQFRGSNTVFGYQGTGGFTFNFNENYALNIAYRYMATDKVDDLGKIFQAHMASAGVIYRFDEALYK
ncbi:outer membrane protein [Legionella dresdenensis]|uniref:Outer membrane protein n=2 Tax=Legionella dresdenensis TaxID=450200 RepID=A0ABV8CCY1_9GAMM